MFDKIREFPCKVSMYNARLQKSVEMSFRTMEEAQEIADTFHMTLAKEWGIISVLVYCWTEMRFKDVGQFKRKWC